jgi:hypothetical protein
MQAGEKSREKGSTAFRHRPNAQRTPQQIPHAMLMSFNGNHRRLHMVTCRGAPEAVSPSI